jgi:hypothetical protein
MLERVDRMQLAVRDRAVAAETFSDVLEAEKVREDNVGLLAARRTVVHTGESEFELLEPSGDGPVAEHLERWGEGIFAGGFSTADVSRLAGRLSEKGVACQVEGEQIFIEPDQTKGMRMVISPAVERERVGLISFLYEVTNIVSDHGEAAAFYAGTFGLDSARFCPIKSDQYGYDGALTLFDPPARLDRIELTQITDEALAMGRFFTRRGESIYMCYVETEDVAAIRDRLEARGGRYSDRSGDPNPDGLFVHPTALHGMLMGVSRTNLAWMWSGRPELAGR